MILLVLKIALIGVLILVKYILSVKVFSWSSLAVPSVPYRTLPPVCK